jgi:hypothetical protein
VAKVQIDSSAHRATNAYCPYHRAVSTNTLRMKKRLLIFAFAIFLAQASFGSSEKFTKNFCEILGMLDEYISRYDYYTGEPRDSIVEHFYPNEQELAKHFFDLIKNYENETTTNFSIRQEVDAEGHTFFYSKTFSAFINSLYKLNSKKLATLDRDLILGLNRKLKLAYLNGAYLRFGNGNEISIANGINKIKTIAIVMESLKIKNIKLYNSGPGSVPMDYVLTFDSSLNLRKILKIKDANSKLKDYPNKKMIEYK